MLFKDRFEAGHVLATKLDEYAGKNGVMVLALPRGGVPVGYEVARVYCLERMIRVADAAISGRRFQNGKPFAQKLADPAAWQAGLYRTRTRFREYDIVLFFEQSHVDDRRLT